MSRGIRSWLLSRAGRGRAAWSPAPAAPAPSSPPGSGCPYATSTATGARRRQNWRPPSDWVLFCPSPQADQPTRWSSLRQHPAFQARDWWFALRRRSWCSTGSWRGSSWYLCSESLLSWSQNVCPPTLWDKSPGALPPLPGLGELEELVRRLGRSACPRCPSWPTVPGWWPWPREWLVRPAWGELPSRIGPLRFRLLWWRRPCPCISNCLGRAEPELWVWAGGSLCAGVLQSSRGVRFVEWAVFVRRRRWGTWWSWPSCRSKYFVFIKFKALSRMEQSKTTGASFLLALLLHQTIRITLNYQPIQISGTTHGLEISRTPPPPSSPPSTISSTLSPHPPPSKH